MSSVRIAAETRVLASGCRSVPMSVRPSRRNVTWLPGNRRPCLEMDDVAIAHESRDMEVRGLAIDLGGGGHLLDHALAKHHDSIGERQRLVLIVRHVDGRAAELAVDASDLARVSRFVAWRRDSRAARPSERAAARRRWRARWRRAAVDLPRAVREACRPVPGAVRVRALARPGCAISAEGTPRMRSPKPTFLRTVMCGKSA